MKSFDQFQNESFVGNAVGIVNRVAKKVGSAVGGAVKKVNVAKPTTGPLAPRTPGQAARNNPAVKAAALRKQSVQNKAAQQPKKNTTVTTPVTKGPFTQTTKSGNKDMPGKLTKTNPNNKPPITGKQVGDFVKKVGSKVQQGAAKVNQIRKDTQPAREKARTGVAKFMASKNVRQGLSKLNQTRKALPTAQDFRNSGDSSGSGFGGSFTGKTVKGVSKALGAQGKEFEDSETKIRKGTGRNKSQEVVVRGREKDADGNPINKKKDTSFKGALGKMVDRATMTTEKKPYKKKKQEEPANKVTAVGLKDDKPPEATSGAKVPNKPKTPSDSSAAKVTSGKGKEPEKPKPTEARGDRQTDKDTAGDTDKIRIGTGGRQQRITGGSDALPVKQGKVGKRRGRPPGSTNKPKPEVPGQQTIPGLNKTGKTTKLDGESKVKTPKKNEQGLGSKVGDAVKTGAKKVATATGDAVKTGAKKVGKAVKDKAVEVGKGVKDEVVSGAKELSKNIEKKVASGKEKRDASRKATGVKVTTNYTKPKKGEEMKVPEKKDKVTVNATDPEKSIREREKQKKEAPKALAQAVANRTEADAARDAVKDMKQSGQKVTDDVRSQLTKTLAKTDSDPNKSTQLKGKSDEELSRSTASSDDEGSFRRNAGRTGKKKTVNPNAPKSTTKKTVKKSYKTTSKKKEEVSESFSHWREEFIWETDKKYPEKVKEIKPMTGKNTITINPEDETSKYKRGY